MTYPATWGYPGGTVNIRMPAAANGAAGTDGELIVIDGDVAYNFWQFKRTSSTTGTAVSFGAENVVTGDGWGSKSPFLGAGITAVGASQLGGLIVKDEMNDGDIDHALQLAVDRNLVKAGAVGQALSSDGSSASGIVQEGQLLAIPPGTPMPSGLSAAGQQVFKAMQTYGAYVVDVAGGTTNVRAQANAFDSATIAALAKDMHQITPLLHAVSNNSGGSTVTPPTTPTNPTNPTTPAVDTTAPTLQSVAASGTGLTNGNGTVHAGDTVSLTLKFSEVVNVTGTPTLALNSNGSAKYVSGAGTDTLKFEYKVAAGETASDLAINGFNLSGVKDKAGNVANLTSAPRQPAGTLVVNTSTPTDPTTPTTPTNPTNPTTPTPIDTTAPKIQAIAASGSGISNGNGTVGAGSTVRLSVSFNEAMTVNGTPTLSLNSNGTAKYVSGSGTNTLQFDYKVAAGEKAADLAVSGFNLGGVTDKAGNAVNLTGAPLQPAGTLAISTSSTSTDTVKPKVQWLSASGSGIRNGNGMVRAGDTVRLSIGFSEAMTVNGTPTLSLSSNGTAKYVGGSGTNTLQFDYKVGSGDRAFDLSVSGFNLGGVTDKAGNAVNLTGAPRQPGGTLVVLSSWSSSSRRTATLSTSESSLAAPATLESSATTASSSSNVTDFMSGSRQTVGYPSAQDQAASSAASDGSLSSKLALLSQYSASSFSTPAAFSTGGLSQGWGDSAFQTLAKPRG
ncbi:MAG TPA: hypothetical protein VGN82_13110 [Bosea sp. (in: a-proteobacteria)]|uniref:hypothetical protein n=1 Tax=Bosea sp. (in: a-proteobacteria) TaxID=1871050 RepID=UPI002E1432BB|nr:hypothetical protein [Bosea sp. (in: a-proteobacteria)]